MRMIMVLAGTIALLAGANTAWAQAGMLHLPKIRACDPATLAPLKGQYPVWDRAGVDPVVPEVLREIRKGGNPRLVVAEALRGPAPTDSKERAAELQRAKQRIEQFNRISLFTAPGTDIRDLPLLPADFSEAFAAATAVENLEEAFIPCGSVIHHVTSAAPDFNGVPQIEVKDAPHVLGWCDTMLEGRCGVWQVQTKAALAVSSGPNKGNFYRFQMILNCGNPNAQFEAPKETVEVTISAPPAQPPIQPEGPPSPPGLIPAVPEPSLERLRKEPAFGFGGGIKARQGWVRTDYDCVDPTKCNAEQLHSTQHLVATGRVSHRMGLFAEGSIALAGRDLNFKFGDPIRKPRSSETSSDRFWSAMSGYEHPISQNLAVYVAGKINDYCVCEHYVGPIDTRVERRFRTYGAGMGLTGYAKRLTIRVDGTLQPWGRRDKWGQQVGYPEGRDVRESASHYGVDAELGFPVSRVELFAAGGWSLRSSARPGPASNAADERTQIKHLSGGVRMNVGSLR